MIVEDSNRVFSEYEAKSVDLENAVFQDPSLDSRILELVVFKIFDAIANVDPKKAKQMMEYIVKESDAFTSRASIEVKVLQGCPLKTIEIVNLYGFQDESEIIEYAQEKLGEVWDLLGLPDVESITDLQMPEKSLPELMQGFHKPFFSQENFKLAQKISPYIFSSLQTLDLSRQLFCALEKASEEDLSSVLSQIAELKEGFLKFYVLATFNHAICLGENTLAQNVFSQHFPDYVDPLDIFPEMEDAENRYQFLEEALALQQKTATTCAGLLRILTSIDSAKYQSLQKWLVHDFSTLLEAMDMFVLAEMTDNIALVVSSLEKFLSVPQTITRNLLLQMIFNGFLCDGRVEVLKRFQENDLQAISWSGDAVVDGIESCVDEERFQEALWLVTRFEKVLVSADIDAEAIALLLERRDVQESVALKDALEKVLE